MQKQDEYITEAMDMLGKGYNNDPIPPNEFISTLSGFTLAPDAIINEHGYVTALVWGVTWRFCQMSDGVCRASLGKIAERLGMSERTIIRHLETLCNGGYLMDTTPNLKNKPHIYADTKKIVVRMNLSAGVTESHPAMTESQRQGDRESVEETSKKEKKKQNIKEGAKAPNTKHAADFPGVVLFREVTERYPAKDTFEIVDNAVKKINSRLGRDAVKDDILPFWQHWRSKGWRPTNLTWLTDWAVSGVIPQQGRPQPANEPKAFDGIRSWLNSVQPEEVVSVNAE